MLLQGGVHSLYAVDVGHGLLHPRIAHDPRVVVMERTNLRTLARLPGAAPDLVTLDLSFISLKAVMPAVCSLATPIFHLVALFKPQFELGRQWVGPGGVVLPGAPVEAEIGMFQAWAEEVHGMKALGAVRAAVKGARGNQEWVLHLHRNTSQ